MDALLCKINSTEPKEISRCVVKLSTSTFSDYRGLHTTRHVRYLFKKCTGYNILADELSNIGAEEVLKSISNLNECSDGMYEITTCNESRDFESGHIDNYDLILIPYEG